MAQDHDQLQDREKLERVLVVHAHPDDMEFAAGGTVAKWSDAGVEVNLVICTEGNRGGEGDRTEDELVKVRREEQSNAARVLGVKEVVYLGYDDGYVTPSLELRKDITRQIRRFRPDAVICPNPVRHFGPIGGNHPDHLAVGEATFAAVYPTARNPMAVPELLRDEGLDKWVVRWMYVAGRPFGDINYFEDITSTVDRKVEALMAHKSQLEPVVGPFMKWMSMQIADKGRGMGLGDFQYAEGFLKIFTGEFERRDDFKHFLEAEGLPMPADDVVNELQASAAES